MGTNYYQRTDVCECCNRYKERHIGKSSAGWQFLFRGYKSDKDMPKIISFEDWKKELQLNGKIFNEYEVEIPFVDFVNMVISKKAEKNNHYDYCIKNSLICKLDSNWKDDAGFSFSGEEFS